MFLLWYHYNGFNQNMVSLGLFWQTTPYVIHIVMYNPLCIFYAYIISSLFSYHGWTDIFLVEGGIKLGVVPRLLYENDIDLTHIYLEKNTK